MSSIVLGVGSGDGVRQVEKTILEDLSFSVSCLFKAAVRGLGLPRQPLMGEPHFILNSSTLWI